MLEVLDSSTLRPELKKAIAASVVQSTMQLHGASDGGKLQVNEHMEHYLTVDDWHKLQPGSGTADLDALKVLVDRCIALGLLHPSETTVRRIVTIKLMARKQVGDAPLALADVREFKRLLRSQLCPGLTTGPAVYSAPDAFKGTSPVLYASCYSDEALPISSPFGQVDFMRATYGTPCRCTKAAAKSQQPSRHSADGGSQIVPYDQQRAQQAMMEQQQQLMHQQITQQHQQHQQQMQHYLQLNSKDEQLTPVRGIPMSWGGKAEPAPTAPAGFKAEPALTAPTGAKGEPVPSASTVPLPPAAGAAEALPCCKAEAGLEGAKAATLPAKSCSALIHAMQTLGTGKGKEPCSQEVPLLKRPAAAEPDSGKKTKKVKEGRQPPSGWAIEKHIRNSGVAKGASYYLYVSPCGKRCRSLAEAAQFSG
jgi:hypothetical protein